MNGYPLLFFSCFRGGGVLSCASKHGKRFDPNLHHHIIIPTNKSQLRAHVEPLRPEQLENLFVTQADFFAALMKVQPSAKREGFATIPDVSWGDVGALEDLREELNLTIMQPINNPKQFTALGLSVPAGVLLFG